MLESLVSKCRGRELLSRNDIAKTEIGVEVRSENLSGYYAFPDGLTASEFMHRAAMEFVMETGQMGQASIF